MDNKPPRLLFFGNERLATGVTTEVPVLRSLIAAGYDIAAVVIAQAEDMKSRKQRPLEVALVAQQHNIPVIAPKSLKEAEIVQELASYHAIAGVLVAFGKIIPQEVIDVFPRGIINIHPSLLPRHRGSTPIESVILNYEKETGVSLMSLTAGMDTGPIYAQETVPLVGNETKQALADKLSLMGADMMIRHLPMILDGTLKHTVQDEHGASVDLRISKDNGSLDVTKPAAELEREIRAYHGWPRTKTLIGTQQVIITKAHASDIQGMAGTLWMGDKQLGIHCNEGTLIIDSLIPTGRKEMPASAFLAGYTP